MTMDFSKEPAPVTMDYSKEPARDEANTAELRVLEKEPFNAEPGDLGKLIQHEVTPECLAYVRNHGPVPKIDPNAHRLTVDGLVKTKKSWSLAELETEFEKKEIVAALQCAGNRRKMICGKKEVKGIKWGEGTLMNARWTGYRLLDILAAAGLARDKDGTEQKSLHVCFASEAAPTQAEPWYGSSVPADLVMDPARSVLLATHMNGKPLSPDHGFPLRVIIPGYTGVRWVKWVQRITISDKESPNFYQQKDYKILPSHVDDMAKAEEQWKDFPPLTENPVNSAIASVESVKDSCLPTVVVKGYAVGDIQAVEVSVDRGKTSRKAKFTYKEGPWSWVVWECQIPVCGANVEGGREDGLVVWSRATDKTGAKQPEECEWNLRGVAFNAIGRWEGKVSF